jgi:hypothetical protein
VRSLAALSLVQRAEAAGTRGILFLDDFVIPREGPPAFTVATDPHFNAGHRRAVADTSVIESHSAPDQEVAMFQAFVRVAGARRRAAAASGDDEASAFWPRASLLTQVVLDACMESGKRAGGMPVPIAPL